MEFKAEIFKNTRNIYFIRHLNKSISTQQTFERKTIADLNFYSSMSPFNKILCQSEMVKYKENTQHTLMFVLMFVVHQYLRQLLGPCASPGQIWQNALSHNSLAKGLLSRVQKPVLMLTGSIHQNIYMDKIEYPQNIPSLYILLKEEIFKTTRNILFIMHLHKSILKKVEF